MNFEQFTPSRNIFLKRHYRNWLCFASKYANGTVLICTFYVLLIKYKIKSLVLQPFHPDYSCWASWETNKVRKLKTIRILFEHLTRDSGRWYLLWLLLTFSPFSYLNSGLTSLSLLNFVTLFNNWISTKGNWQLWLVFPMYK